jgi:pilus assembly protein CpaC
MKIRPIEAALLPAALFFTLILSPVSAAETLQVRPGFQKILEKRGATRISIGNPDIIEARSLPRGDGILVVGKKEGETDLVVWTKEKRTDWKVEVRERSSFAAEEIRAFAASFPGLSVTEAGNALILEGTVRTAQDKKLCEDFARQRPNVHLRISLPEDRKALLSYDLKIMEISKGVSSQLGIRWPDYLPFKAAASSGSGTGTLFTMSSDFEARLNLLMADGRARILANPRLVCESGESATFLGGGEIPIVIITPETRTVEWKTYGIILKLAPKMDGEGRIRTQITAEISTIDHASGTAEVPGFLTRRVTTFFSGPSGGTVMLSGLVKSEMAKDVAKVPLLGQIPVLGELFKSRSFRENQSELAVFITPSEIRGDFQEETAAWQAKVQKEKEAMRFRLID